MEDVGPSMDQELAKKLFFEGGTLVILNLPAESEFGIDLKSWRTGSKFKGVKMIPPGLHMYHYKLVTIPNLLNLRNPKLRFRNWRELNRVADIVNLRFIRMLFKP